MTIKDLNEKTKKCCFCGRPLSPRECCNPWPANKDEGAVCCHTCDDTIVAKARGYRFPMEPRSENPILLKIQTRQYMFDEIQKLTKQADDIVFYNGNALETDDRITFLNLIMNCADSIKEKCSFVLEVLESQEIEHLQEANND